MIVAVEKKFAVEVTYNGVTQPSKYSLSNRLQRCLRKQSLPSQSTRTLTCSRFTAKTEPWFPKTSP